MILNFAKDIPDYRLKLNQKVSKIVKNEENVEIYVHNGIKEEIIKCKKVICTVPLGILKDKLI